MPTAAPCKPPARIGWGGGGTQHTNQTTQHTTIKKGREGGIPIQCGAARGAAQQLNYSSSSTSAH
eukprot:12452816-Prorocentrum_lima.AAC.1